MKSHTAQFRSLAWAVVLTAMAAVGPVNAEERSSVMTQETQAATTPAKALQMLKQGNTRFVAGEATDYDYLAQAKQTASGQFPFASVLSCTHLANHQRSIVKAESRCRAKRATRPATMAEQQPPNGVLAAVS